MVKKILALILIFIPLTAQAQDWSIAREQSNVWVAHCVSCHASYNELSKTLCIAVPKAVYSFPVKALCPSRCTSL